MSQQKTEWKMDVQNSFFSRQFVCNSDYTRHNSRLYKIRTTKTNWCTRELVLRHEIKIIIHILYLGMSLLMIRLGIKNSLASHVLVLYLHVVFSKAWSEQKHVVMCLIQKNFTKMKMVSSRPRWQFRWLHFMNSQDLQHSDCLIYCMVYTR